MSKNIILCGVGGQGTVLASKLIAAAAMKKGLAVMSAETIGMAQRGGSVFSHLRIGDDVFSPMISAGTADIIIAFEPAEAVRMLPYLKKTGTVVVSTGAIMPVTAALKSSSYTGSEMIEYLQKNVSNLVVANAADAIEQIGSPKVLNMLLLGAAVRSTDIGVDIDDIKSVMCEKVKEKFIDMNMKALDFIKINNQGVNK